MSGDSPRSVWSRVRALWDGLFFQEMSPIRLAVCRIVVALTQLTLFLPPLSWHQAYIRYNGGFEKPQAAMALLSALFGEDAVRSEGAATIVYWATVAAAVLAVVGLFTRTACLVFALGYTLLISHLYSYNEIHHIEGLNAILFLLLAFSDSGRALSVDAWWARRRGASPREFGVDARSLNVAWVVVLMHIVFSLAYLDAGASKLWTGGFRWLNGYTMQRYLLVDALRSDRPLGLWASQHHWLSLVMSYYAIGFECLFCVTFVWRRLLPWFLLGGVGLHLGIVILQGAPFWDWMLLYLLFVPTERLPIWGRATAGAEPPALAAQGPGSRAPSIS